MLPQGGAEHSQEEILADCDLTTARKGKTMTKHMTGVSRSSATSGKMKTAPQALMKSVIVLSVRAMNLQHLRWLGILIACGPLLPLIPPLPGMPAIVISNR